MVACNFCHVHDVCWPWMCFQILMPAAQTTQIMYSHIICSIFVSHRKAILDMAINVHHDFGKFNSSLSVSLTPSNLALVKSNPNVNWFEGDGRVIYCSIR